MASFADRGLVAVEGSTLRGARTDDGRLGALIERAGCAEDSAVSRVVLEACHVGPRTIAALAAALRENPCLRELRVHGLRGGGASSSLWPTVFRGVEEAEDTNLTTVVIDRTNLRDSDVAAIAPAFRRRASMASRNAPAPHAPRRAKGDEAGYGSDSDESLGLEVGGEAGGRESGDGAHGPSVGGGAAPSHPPSVAVATATTSNLSEDVQDIQALD